MHFSVFLVFFALYNRISSSQRIGDRCRVNGVEGRCILRENCQKVIEDFNNYNIQPKFCVFNIEIILICCPQREPSLSTTEAVNTNSYIREIFRREPATDHFYATTTERHPYSYHNLSNNVNNNKGLDTETERISARKCKEYREFSKRKRIITPLLVDPVPIVDYTPVCDTVNPLIVGGEAAKIGDFPHMVALGYEMSYQIEWKCGGSLISKKFVLTAAHCIKTIDRVEPTIARVGGLNLKNPNRNETFEDILIRRTIVHPQYSTKQVYNDIGLIELQKQVKFSSNLRPACLWQSSNIGLSKATATGYGKTEFLNQDNSNELLKVELLLYPNDECQQYYRPDSQRKYPRGVISSQLCAGSNGERKDSCQGDSGGPLSVVLRDNQCLHYVVGITSNGIYCGGVEPGIYTRVSSYIEWIESNVWVNTNF